MNVSLAPQLEAYVKRKIASGKYRSASKVVREALHLMDEMEREGRDPSAALRREIQIGIDQADRGELLEVDDVIRELREKNGPRQAVPARRPRRRSSSCA